MPHPKHYFDEVRSSNPTNISISNYCTHCYIFPHVMSSTAQKKFEPKSATPTVDDS